MENIIIFVMNVNLDVHMQPSSQEKKRSTTCLDVTILTLVNKSKITNTSKYTLCRKCMHELDLSNHLIIYSAKKMDNGTL